MPTPRKESVLDPLIAPPEVIFRRLGDLAIEHALLHRLLSLSLALRDEQKRREDAGETNGNTSCLLKQEGMKHAS